MEDTRAIDSLPDDPAALKSIIAALARQRDEASRQRDDAARRCDEARRAARELEVQKLRLEVELLRLRKLYYGPRADRLNSPGDVAQMLLAFGGELEARPVDPQDLPVEIDPAEADSVRRVRKGRRNLAAFDHLPVTRHVHDLPEDRKPCPGCGKAREKIGEESSWQVEYVPARFERIEHVRVKYACRRCEAAAENPRIMLSDKPTQPVEKGLAGPGLLAYVVTSKYSDYLPLYRLKSIFARNGFGIDRATQCVWCRDVAEIARPLYDRMVERVLGSHVVATDDTVMPMQAAGKAKQARIWVYVGDEANPYNVFDFTTSRSRDGPAAFLGDSRQALLADGYGGYDGVVVGNDITRAGCWAHARRKFVDAEKAHPAIAAEAVGSIKRLYAVEERGRTLDDEGRRRLRRSESAPPCCRRSRTSCTSGATGFCPSTRWPRRSATASPSGRRFASSPPTGRCRSTTTPPNGR